MRLADKSVAADNVEVDVKSLGNIIKEEIDRINRTRKNTGDEDRNILLFGEKCMKYIAHREEDREQLLLDHLTGTAEKAKEFAEVFGKGEWGYCCGMLHDLGKIQ